LYQLEIILAVFSTKIYCFYGFICAIDIDDKCVTKNGNFFSYQTIRWSNDRWAQQGL